MKGFLTAAVLCVMSATAVQATDDEALQLERLANRFVAESLKYDPTLAYETGLPTRVHDRFADHSPSALAARDAEEAAELKALGAIDPARLPATSRAIYALLKEQLESDQQLRVCHRELWNVDHIDGWISKFADVVDKQPVGTSDLRAQALRRFGSVPHYVDIEIANLRRGLKQGYAAPQSVVHRVIAQLDGLVALPPDESPYFVARRDSDPAFRVAFTRLIADRIGPALRRYREFLADEYLPQARSGIALSDLPDGAACYQAYLRYFTTLSRTPQEVYDLGMRTVEANKADIVRVGAKLFGTEDFDKIVAASKARPENHFRSKEELLQYSQAFIVRAKEKAASLIDRLPKQDCAIEPERDFEDQAGVSSHYDPDPDPSNPGFYHIELGNWQAQTRGEAEVTVVHEVWPGHHLQIALAREIAPNTPLNRLSFNSAYVEGWARYAEAIAEEADIYKAEDAAILRRVWPARGMVVDPGLHAFHWTRQQAVEYLVGTGRFDEKGAENLIDRIAVLPGQLTAYDSGGLEIKSLRTEAQAALGPKFDVREFNRTVLDEGIVPLGELRRHVESWINNKK
jgi:uncharacterized protein (DUF885 family)